MAFCEPYHTNSSEYEPMQKEVFHEKDSCPDGKRIKREHRENGKGHNRRRCKECEKVF